MKMVWIKVNNVLVSCPYCKAVQYKSCKCKDCKRKVAE